MFLFFACWIIFFSAFNCQLFAHPPLVSITTMDVDAEAGNIDLYIRICTEDLEMILHNKYNVDGWIGTPAEHHDSRKLLMKYVNERFTITVNNNEKIALLTDSMAIDNDMMFFYMKGISKQAIKQIEVNNRLLTDFFSNQRNLVLIGITGRSDKGYVLNRNNSTIMLSL